MEKILISACLIGEKTRYDGTAKVWPFYEKLAKKYELVPFCPEVEGGLSIPRDPAEIVKNAVVTKKGVDVTKNYNDGAAKALAACKFFGIRIAILKDNSPACGSRHIHDGSFTDAKIEGLGVTARLLIANGIKVYAESDNLEFLLGESQDSADARLRRNLKKEEERKAVMALVKDGTITQEEADRRLIQKKENRFGHGHGGRGFHHDSYHSGDASYSRNRQDGHSSYGEKRPYGPSRDGEHSRTSYGKKPYGEKSHYEGHSSYHKSYDGASSGDKPYSHEGSSYGKKNYSAGGEHSSYHKNYHSSASYSSGEKRPYQGHGYSHDEKSKAYGEHSSYHKDYQHSSYSSSEKRPYQGHGYGHSEGGKSYGDHSSYSSSEKRPYQGHGYGHSEGGKSYGDHSSYAHGGEKKSHYDGQSSHSYGGKKTYGGGKPNYGHSSYGTHKPYGGEKHYSSSKKKDSK